MRIFLDKYQINLREVDHIQKTPLEYQWKISTLAILIIKQFDYEADVARKTLWLADSRTLFSCNAHGPTTSLNT